MFKKGSYLYYALGNGLFYFSWAMFSCIISVYLAGINCSATEISLITSAAALFAMVTQPVTGFLADKFRSPKKVAMVTGGNGGGRPDMAQAGGKQPEKLNDAFAKAHEVIQSQIK